MSNHLDTAICSTDIEFAWTLDHEGMFPASTRRARFAATSHPAVDAAEAAIDLAAPRAPLHQYAVQSRSDVTGRWLPSWTDDGAELA